MKQFGWFCQRRVRKIRFRAKTFDIRTSAEKFCSEVKTCSSQMTGVAGELKQNQPKAKSSSSSAATNQATSSKISPPPPKFKLPSQRSQSLEQKSSLDKSPYSSLACKNFF